MSNNKVKLQLGESVKMIAKKPFSSIVELNQIVKSTYPKRLQNKEIALKYKDEEGEWINISDDEDTVTFNEFVSTKTGDKVKIVVEVVKKQNKKQQDQKMQDEVKEVSDEFGELKLEDEKKQEKKVNFEDLEDFKIDSVLKEIEKMFNSEEKFGPQRIFRTFVTAAKGTKAEVHLRRMMKMIRRHQKGGSHGFRNSSERKHWKKHGHKNTDSSSPDEQKRIQKPFYGPEMFGFPGFFCGPEGQGPAGHKWNKRGPNCRGPRGHHSKDKHAMRLFKKFIKQYRDESSSSSSSEDVNVENKPVITNFTQE